MRLRPTPLLYGVVCALSVAFAAALVWIAPAAAGPACGWQGYSYAGLESAARAYGVAATVTSLAPPRVESGHVAAWVGVGGHGAGPGGSDAWIQVGLSAFPGSSGRLYYELKRPETPVRYVELGAPVPAGERHRVAVLELASKPNWWRAWVDGRPVTPPVLLRGSHGSWKPVATTESWDGGRPACNRYRYRYERVMLASRAGGGWTALSTTHVIRSPRYRVIRRPPAGFDAFSAG